MKFELDDRVRFVINSEEYIGTVVGVYPTGKWDKPYDVHIDEANETLEFDEDELEFVDES